MTREELEHAIRAACDLANDTEVIVFGSQAILGQFPDAPDALRQSAEADIAPKHAIDKIELIDAVLGEDSSFHRTHGFYVHGIPIDAAVLPAGWERRAVKVQNDAGQADANACRAYVDDSGCLCGAPSAELIANAIRKATHDDWQRRAPS